MALRKRHCSKQGLEFIAAFEGFVPECYDDGGAPGKGNCTIGYGHLVHAGPTTPADRHKWGKLSHEQALELLAKDVAAAEAAVVRYCRPIYNQARFDAAVSLVFNCGGGVLTGSVGRAINHFAKTAALAAAWEAWCHFAGGVNAGLLRRRKAEVCLWLTGHYTRAQGNKDANAG